MSGSRLTSATYVYQQSGLLGFTALRKNKAILDFNTLRLHFCGPGEYELEKEVPPGTDTYQLEVAPSGHIVLPCFEFQEAGPSTQHSLTLLTKNDSNNTNHCSSSHGSKKNGNTQRSAAIPPPPTAPPVLPASCLSQERRNTPPPAA